MSAKTASTDEAMTMVVSDRGAGGNPAARTGRTPAAPEAAALLALPRARRPAIAHAPLQDAPRLPSAALEPELRKPVVLGGPQRSARPWSIDAVEWIALVAGALLMALVVKAFLFQAFLIPSRSMEPTLGIDDRVLVFKPAYHLGPVERGDVVVFARPDGLDGVIEDSDLIKRVIGLPGEVVQGRMGRVFVNERLLAEPWVSGLALTSDFGPVKVPQGAIWVMGDNRGNSQDSRVFGLVDQTSVRGEALLRWWPITRFGGL